QRVGAGAVVEVGGVPAAREGGGPGGQGDRGRADAAGAAVEVVGARVGSGRGAGDQGAVAARGGELEGGAGPGGGLRGAAFPPAGRRGVRAVRVGRPAGAAFEVVGVDGVGRLLRAA